MVANSPTDIVAVRGALSGASLELGTDIAPTMYWYAEGKSSSASLVCLFFLPDWSR